MPRLHQAYILILAAVSALGIACSSTSVSAEGESGMLKYKIETGYELDGSLTEEALATNLDHLIEITLTEKGASRVQDPWNIHHRVQNSNLILENVIDPDAPQSVPNLRLQQSAAGTLNLQAIYEDDILDSITLHFSNSPQSHMLVEAPDYLWGGWEEKEGEDITIETNDHAELVAIPMDRFGKRLVGCLRTEIDITPLFAVIPGSNLQHSVSSDFAAEGRFTLTFPQSTEVSVSLYIPHSKSRFSKTFHVLDDPVE